MLDNLSFIYLFLSLTSCFLSLASSFSFDFELVEFILGLRCGSTEVAQNMHTTCFLYKFSKCIGSSQHGPPQPPRAPPEFFGEPGGRGELAKKFRGGPGGVGGAHGAPWAPNLHYSKIVIFIQILK